MFVKSKQMFVTEYSYLYTLIDKYGNKKQKKIITRHKLIIENSPPVNNLKDLISIGKTLKFYKS